MGGLNLMGGAQVGVSSGGYSNTPRPATASEAAFGTAASPTERGLGALAPNDAGGVAFWWSMFSVAALMFLYFTLPE